MIFVAIALFLAFPTWILCICCFFSDVKFYKLMGSLISDESIAPLLFSSGLWAWALVYCRVDLKPIEEKWPHQNASNVMDTMMKNATVCVLFCGRFLLVQLVPFTEMWINGIRVNDCRPTRKRVRCASFKTTQYRIRYQDDKKMTKVYVPSVCCSGEGVN